MLRRIIGLAVCVCVCVAGTARAQSFGRNKVHYDALDFVLRRRISTSTTIQRT